MQIGTITMENSLEYHKKKLKIEPQYDPTSGHIYGETIIQKDRCNSMFTEALFTIAKTWKQTKCPLTDEWIKEMCI